MSPAEGPGDSGAPPQPAQPKPEDATSAESSLFGDIHASTLALRKRIASAHAFRDRSVAVLAVAGLAVWAILVIAPVLRPGLAEVTVRLATIGALTFLVAAPGYWLGLGHRSLAIAMAIVLGLYLATALLGRGRVDDLFGLATVLAFLIFGLAGFNLVFVLEEMIYDAHRLLPHRRHVWLLTPLVLDAALCIALPIWWAFGGPFLPTFWVAALATTLILASWWFIRTVNNVDRRQIVIRELHLFAAGILAASLLTDAVQYIVGIEGGLDTLLVFLVLLGTWVYVSYTTLQRTHLLLQGRNAAPWAAILLAATYAIAAHGQGLFLQSGTGAVQELFSRRMAFMIVGIWVGIAFYAARGLWRAMRLVGQLRTITPRGRAVAGQAARLAQGVLRTERVVEQAARGLYLGLDRALPGTPRAPDPPSAPAGGWVLDEDLHVHTVDEASDTEE